MSQISSLLLRRVEDQTGSHIKKEKHSVIFDENFLPTMQEVSDWTVSGTKQWNNDELQALQSTPAADLGTYFGQNIEDPWLHMAAVAEFIMHNEDSRAIEFTQALLAARPDAERGLNHHFGQKIMEALKNDSQVNK